MLTLYLSAPIFSQSERRWNRLLAGHLTEAIKDCRVLLPQDITVSGRFNDRRHFPIIFRQCMEWIREADIIVAILDGQDVDSGVAFEVGYGYAIGKQIIGVRTDFRQNQERGVNVMLSRACTSFLLEMSFGENTEQLVRDLAGKIVAAIKSLKSGKQRGSS